MLTGTYHQTRSKPSQKGGTIKMRSVFKLAIVGQSLLVSKLVCECVKCYFATVDLSLMRLTLGLHESASAIACHC